MKTTIVAILLLVSLFGMAYAQNSPIDKGSKIVGGGFSYISTGKNPDDFNTLTLNPSLGIFVQKGLLIGGSLLYQHSSMANYSMTKMGLGPEIRYYFEKVADRPDKSGIFYPYLKITTLYYKTTDDNNIDGSANYSNFKWAAGGGIQIMISNTVGGYGEMTWGSNNYKPESRDSWYTEREIAFVVGFSYFLY